jgi:hypothetical protein
MKNLEEIIKENLIVFEKIGRDGGMGFYYFAGSNKPMSLVFSFGDGWDHVSASFKNRLPSWYEMCKAKELFFYDYETVIQYHPAKDQNINIHNHVLHLWRPQKEEIILPPKYMV